MDGQQLKRMCNVSQLKLYYPTQTMLNKSKTETAVRSDACDEGICLNENSGNNCNGDVNKAMQRTLVFAPNET
jgi:hypothetical protein